jgi:Major Facilitator Superfamily.
MLTVEEISRLYTGIAIAVLVGYLIAGHVVDKLGSILSLILLNSLALILIPTFALAPILIALICFTLLSFLDSLNIARDKFVIENVNPEHRSLMLGSYRSITALPRIIGPLIGSILWNISPILVFIATAMLIPIDISILTILYFTLKSKSYATNKSTN